MSQERPKRAVAVAARVKMVNGQFDLPAQTLKSMGEIREAVAETAEKIAASVERNEKHDIGRLIAALDHLQQAKNIACDSLILPHAPPQ